MQWNNDCSILWFSRNHEISQAAGGIGKRISATPWWADPDNRGGGRPGGGKPGDEGEGFDPSVRKWGLHNTDRIHNHEPTATQKRAKRARYKMLCSNSVNVPTQA